MVSSFVNRCIWAATSSGLGDFVVNAPSQNGFTPAQCASPAVVDGGYYHYFAVNGAENEEGDGQYTAGTTTLSRLTIRTSSNSGSKVNFSAAPTVFMGGPTSLDMPTVIATTSNIALYVASYGVDSNTGTSVGTAATNGTTSTSSPTLHFASVPSFVAANQMVWDSTTNLYVGEVLSTGVGTVTLVANAANAVGSGDTLVFANPLLTLQHALNAAASYDYQGLYAPTINVADGTYTNVQVILLALVNCPAGGSIVGNATTPTNVKLTDAGTAWTFSAYTYASWTINGVDFHGSYGGIAVNEYAQIAVNNLNFSGSLSQGGLSTTPYGFLNATGSTIRISTSAMEIFYYGRGISVFDSSTITVANAVTFTPFFIGLDAAARFYANSMTITNGSNVTASSNGLIMTNGPFFEADSTTKVDGVLLTRTNFPGGNVSIDGSSYFQPDHVGVVPLYDLAGNQWADYNKTSAGAWTFSPVGGSLNIVSAGTTGTVFSFNNTSTGGHNDVFGTVGSATFGGLPVGYGFLLDATSGNFPFWWGTAGNFNLWATLGWGASSNGSYTVPTIDTGLSRLAAGSLAVGNGTAGDTTGSITLKDVILTPLTVATLPAPSTALKGARAFVTDELASVAFNTIATGGGSNNVPVFCDGTNWRIG